MIRTRGYTLIESLVVIALTGVTLTVVTVVMHTLHRAERRVRDDLQGQRTLVQLAAQLRWDAHEAIAATVVAAADRSAQESQPTASGSPARSVILELADGRSIQFSLATNRLERVVRRADAVEHREDFLLAGSEAYWTIDASRHRPLVTLHLTHPAPTQQLRSPGLNEQLIRATVGVSASGSQAITGGRDENQP